MEIALKGDKSEVHHCIAFLKAQTEENPIADFLVWADARAMVAIAKTDNSDVGDELCIKRDVSFLILIVRVSFSTGRHPCTAGFVLSLVCVLKDLHTI